MKQLPLLSHKLSGDMWTMSAEETDERVKRLYYPEKRTRQDKCILTGLLGTTLRIYETLSGFLFVDMLVT